MHSNHGKGDECARARSKFPSSILIGFKRIIIYRGAKSQFTYVGLNSSVTECPIEIILSGMTYYHHMFEEFVKSNCVWPFELRFY